MAFHRHAARPRGAFARGFAPGLASILAAATLVLSSSCSGGSAADAADAADAGDGFAARPLLDVYEAVYALASDYPSLARVDTIGFGASASYPDGDPSLPILALRLAGSDDASLPAAQLVGAMHGDEQIGAEVALALARAICASRGDGTVAGSLLGKMSLSFIPVVNPWGYGADERYDCGGVDLNRNFSWAWSYGAAGAKGTSAMSELESRVLADDAEFMRYALSITLHSGSYCISLPWDYLKTSSGAYDGTDGYYYPGATGYPDFSSSVYASEYSPAQALFEAEGSAYANSVNGAAGTSSFSSTQGGDWYIVCGSYADWLYAELGCPCYTVELDGRYDWTSQALSLRAKVLSAHETALLNLLGSTGTGIHGRVLGESGSPASDAKVTATAIATAASSSRALAAPEPVEYTAFAYSNGEGYYFIALPTGSGPWTLVAASSDGELASKGTDADAGPASQVLVLSAR
jgi:hypothetical protein